MNQAMLFNLVGTALIIFAVILHIVCLATPYYSEANMNDFAKDVAKLVEEDPSIVGPTGDQDLSQIMAGFNAVQGNINFGMWKLCINADQEGFTLDMCLTWSTETAFDQGTTGQAVSLESEGWVRAVQAMAIIGVLIGGAGMLMAVINLVTRSKGDRLRLFYIIIAICCVVSGVFILLGDLIMAANYKDIFNPMMKANQLPPPPKVYDLFKDQFYLSWGFALDIVAVALIFLSGLAHLMGGRVALSGDGVV